MGLAGDVLDDLNDLADLLTHVSELGSALAAFLGEFRDTLHPFYALFDSLRAGADRLAAA